MRPAAAGIYGGQVMGRDLIVEERVRVGYVHASIGEGSVSLQ